MAVDTGSAHQPNQQPGHTITQFHTSSIQLLFLLVMGLPSLISKPEQKIWIFGRFGARTVGIGPCLRGPSFPALSRPWYPISHPRSAIVGCDTCDRHTDYGFDAQKLQYFYNISHCHVCHTNTMAGKAGRRWVRLRRPASHFSAGRLFSCRREFSVGSPCGAIFGRWFGPARSGTNSPPNGEHS